MNGEMKTTGSCDNSRLQIFYDFKNYLGLGSKFETTSKFKLVVTLSKILNFQIFRTVSS